MIIVNFIRDKEVGLFARAKRVAKVNTVERVDVPLNGGGCTDEHNVKTFTSRDDSDNEGTRRRR